MKFAAGIFAVLMVLQFTGCARQTTSAPRSSFNGSALAVGGGVKPASQVAPCCRPLAEGRIGLDQCMENPTCKANNRTCCMQAIQ